MQNSNEYEDYIMGNYGINSLTIPVIEEEIFIIFYTNLTGVSVKYLGTFKRNKPTFFMNSLFTHRYLGFYIDCYHF